jgi:hypothetical protein
VGCTTKQRKTSDLEDILKLIELAVHLRGGENLSKAGYQR